MTEERVANGLALSVIGWFTRRSSDYPASSLVRQQC